MLVGAALALRFKVLILLPTVELCTLLPQQCLFSKTSLAANQRPFPPQPARQFVTVGSYEPDRPSAPLTHGKCGQPINSRMIQVENAGKELAADFAESGTNPMSSFEQIGKRAFDIAAATIALLLLSPLILLVCLVIKLDSRGPVLCRYKRCGINNETIEVFEFRSTTAGHESQTVDHAARKNCSVTRFGGILRGSDIDKIPQLINVLRGEMSIVGPRPYLTAPGDTLRAQISLLPHQRHVKPGIFSWRESQWLWRGD